jgi:hypothetical protein
VEIFQLQLDKLYMFPQVVEVQVVLMVVALQVAVVAQVCWDILVPLAETLVDQINLVQVVEAVLLV